MASIINASSTGSGGIVQTADASGVLQLQSNGSVVVAINSATQVSIATANTGGALTTSTTAGNWGVLIYDGTNNASMLQFRNNVGSAAGNISLSSAGATSILISSVAGVNFPATQVASADANTLDDYEEGTFTPALTAGTTNPTVTYVVQSGNYTKVGRVVSISARLQISAISGGSGAIRISGLPFANAMGICGAHASWISTLTLPVGTTWADTYFEGNDLHLCIAASGTAAGAQQLSIGAVGASFDTSIQFTYQTS